MRLRKSFDSVGEQITKIGDRLGAPRVLVCINITPRFSYGNGFNVVRQFWRFRESALSLSRSYRFPLFPYRISYFSRCGTGYGPHLEISAVKPSFCFRNDVYSRCVIVLKKKILCSFERQLALFLRASVETRYALNK